MLQEVESRLIFVIICSCIDLDGILCGPLHSQNSVELYKTAIADAKAQVRALPRF